MNPKDINSTTVILERLKYGLTTRLSKEFAITAKVDASDVAGFMEDNLVFRLRQDVLGQKLDTVEAKWPTDWWQAVKERFAPAWCLRRWPVRYHHRILEAKVLYPMIALPNDRHTLRITMQKWNDEVGRRD